MAPDQKKNILDQAIDLFSNRDEKAAAEEANLKAAAAQEAAGRAAADKAAAEQAAADAQAKLKDMEAKAAADANAKAAAAANAAAVEARNADIKKMLDAQKAAEVLDTHTVVAGETLSDISMKYYKSSIRDKWIKIYEANKDVIGDNPSIIKAGQVLKIPKI
jgi:nucleoid-associated protein YgaU